MNYEPCEIAYRLSPPPSVVGIVSATVVKDLEELRAHEFVREDSVRLGIQALHEYNKRKQSNFIYSFIKPGSQIRAFTQ